MLYEVITRSNGRSWVLSSRTGLITNWSQDTFVCQPPGQHHCLKAKMTIDRWNVIIGHWGGGQGRSRTADTRRCTGCLYLYSSRQAQQNHRITSYNVCYTKLLRTSEDIVGYNNSAFYLEQKGFYMSAIYLLNKILEASPNRTVAFIT